MVVARTGISTLMLWTGGEGVNRRKGMGGERPDGPTVRAPFAAIFINHAFVNRIVNRDSSSW
jgi:hypothetical protein